jgi:hypothetical protein
VEALLDGKEAARRLDDAFQAQVELFADSNVLLQLLWVCIVAW